MRIGSVSALVLSAFALAACEGVPSVGPSTDISSLAMCGLACPNGIPGPGIVDANGDGIDDNADGNDSSTDGGNTASLTPATSDTTIALEKSIYVKPASGTSLSVLAAGTSPATTTAQILSGTKPTKMTIAIDTKSASNGSWPTPVQMTEYVFGSTALDPTGMNNGGTNCAPSCGYREYRAFSQTPGKERDESLQVWAWNQSYATQYRNTPSGGEAAQQAWSFGGNKTAVMPIIGAMTYNGRFVGTAKTANYLKPDGANIDPNALWRIEGASSVNANFATGAVNGTLTPHTWTSFQSGISGNYMKTVGVPPVAPATLLEEPDYSFYNSTVTLNGTIAGNTYAGTANLNNQFISSDQTMYGGFFGAAAPNPAETAGVFHVTGADPFPIGGSAGVNDDRRAYLTIDGAFHGQ